MSDTHRKGSDSSKRAKSASKSSSSKAPGYIMRQRSVPAMPVERQSAGARGDLEKQLMERGGPVYYEEIMELSHAVDDYLVDPGLTPPIIFQRLKVTVGESCGEVLFDQRLNADSNDLTSGGQVSYELPARVLGAICTAYMEFKSTIEIKKFRMVERFYLGNTLLKDVRFDFGFCIPGSVNTASITYESLPISDDLRQEILDNPRKVRADSFFFNGDVLFMHHMSDYTYYQ